MAKPASGTSVNASDPISANLAAAWGFLEGTGTSSADGTGNGHTLTLASAGYWTTVGGDPVLAIGSANATPASVASPIAINATTSWSIAWRAKQTTSGNAGMLCGNTANTNEYTWMNGTQISFRNNVASGVAFTGQTPTVLANYVLTSDGAAPTTTLRLYKDGVLVTSQTISGSAGSAWTINAVGNGYTGSTLSLIGQLDYLYVWTGRVLTLTDAGTLNTDPYQPYRTSGASFTASPATIPANHSGNITITLTGSGTSWDGTTVFTPSGVSGVTKVSQNVTSATAATLVVTTGATTGTLTITESATGSATTNVAVSTASFTISPSSGNTGVTQTVTATGTNTVWTQETASTLFSVSGGTGSSLSTINVVSNTSATFSLVNGSATGSLTVTDNSTGATQTFTVASSSGTLAVTNPGAKQAFQRNGSNTASFTVSGTYTGTAPTSIEVSLAGGAYVALTSATIGGGNFTGTATLTVTPFTPGAQGTLTVRSLDAGSSPIATATVAKVSIGEVIVTAGQSNADGRLYLAQTYDDSTFDAMCFPLGGSAWQEADDPTSSTTANGSFWPLLATQLMAELGVPVAFITTAVGSTGLVGGSWAAPSAGAVNGGAQYAAMKTRVTASKVNGVHLIIWYQGEADAIAAVTRPQYLDGFRAFAKSAAADLPGSPKTLPFQLGFNNANIDGIRLAISDAVSAGGDVAPGMPSIYDQSNTTHPGSTSGDQALGALQAHRIWAAVSGSTFGGSYPSRGPRVLAVNHSSDRTEIAIAFDQTLKTGLTFTTSIWAVTSNGSPATVLSVAYSATDTKAVILTLSSAATLPITVAFGLGGSTAGKVVPLGPDITMPDGSGAINLPAEPFSAITSSGTEPDEPPVGGGLIGGGSLSGGLQ